MWDHEFTSEPITVVGPVAADWAATQLAASGIGGDGLYVATSDGGAREALAFWAAAAETGFAFASPAAFPWTLANSPTGRISQELGITGPCMTLVGDDDAVAEAFALATDDLAAGRVSRAVVVRLGSKDPVLADGAPTRLTLAASVLTRGGQAARSGSGRHGA